LRFQPLRPEHYDFAIPADRWERPAVKALVRALSEDGTVRDALDALGFARPDPGVPDRVGENGDERER
jgi:molybdate-binding protein